MTRPAIVPELRPLAASLMILGTVLVSVQALLYAGEGTPRRLDRWLGGAVGDSGSRTWPAPVAVDWLAGPAGRILSVAVVTAICVAAGRRRLAVVTLVGSLLITATTVVLKQLVGRTIHGEFLSYPSGHTATAVALGLVLGLLFGDVLGAGRWTGVLVVLSASIAGVVMAWAQIVLTAHYPTDAIGGAGCAAVVLTATAFLVDRLPQANSRRGVS